MSADIVIRPIEADQQSSWLPLWRGYQAFYKVDIPDDVSAVTWARLLDAGEPVHGALAWQGERAVGLVHYIFHRSTWMAENYCYLNDLFVYPEVRGGGIGRALIEHVYAAAQAKGTRRVYWLTHETNSTAIKLYEQVAQRPGFVQFYRILP
ncbi:GNAT family N-acetyltransferase [Starkeya sp. ORNL1]|uniref:GNAT family N-acetyltransferase n=1 Tax=Starkeya sp. ORNL1 TaxID=2709380 RepID=UPI001462A3DE|nr:GNAT family N-acetyltransferase [Starkeya sp. ORNL1]QJP15285.1 GNAT family N-acetyltransferase [Starkeya sp. ORNL1]